MQKKISKKSKSNNIKRIFNIRQQKTVKVTFNIKVCHNCYVLTLDKSLYVFPRSDTQSIDKPGKSAGLLAAGITSSQMLSSVRITFDMFITSLLVYQVLMWYHYLMS